MGDFEECGEVVSLRLPKNEEGNPRGIAFIEYKDKESCEKAIKFDGEEYAGRYLKVKMAGDPPDSKGKGKDGKGKDGKGKGKGKEGKGKGKKGKGSSEAKAKRDGAIVASEGKAQTFDDSDDE